MAYKIPSERRERLMAVHRMELVKHTDRKTKENYLRRIGLFKESAIKEMSDERLNDLVDTALKSRGI